MEWGVPDSPGPSRQRLNRSRTVAGHAGNQLQIWLGSIKLDNAFPTQESLRQLLYGSESASAEEADVIAVFMTDLLLNNENVNSLRYMLKKVLRDSEDYIVNESDRNLLIRYIPAQLVKPGESGHGGRYMSMSVAVHRRHVRCRDDVNGGFECFPTPVMLSCKSPRKNVLQPSFKGIMAQVVHLRSEHREMELLLLGANLDTQDEPKLAQLDALDRLLKVRKRGLPFCSLMWGDFNSRIVAFEELKPMMRICSKANRFLLEESGVTHLMEMIKEQSGRRALLEKDALVFKGRDVSGKDFHSRSNSKMREMFRLHIDAPHLEVPLPSYKRTPVDHMLSETLGFRLRLEDLAVEHALQRGISQLPSVLSDLRDRYFGWTSGDRCLQRAIKVETAESGSVPSSPTASASSGNLYLQLGWPDGVGIYKDSSARAELETWETDDAILAGDHLPMRSIVSIKWEEAGCKLKVWLGFIKLENKYPTQAVLQQLLYGSESSSADDADVVALFLTDLVLSEENVDSLRHMLRKALRKPDEYILNEEDPGLLV
ncbi:unnamed protein product, partial [Polarella glacialis]